MTKKNLERMFNCLIECKMAVYQYSFEKLEVWKLGRILVKEIYKITDGFPQKEIFGLVSQLQRASVSIVSNLAEGMNRKSDKEN